jgi:hypothetical protein
MRRLPLIGWGFVTALMLTQRASATPRTPGFEFVAGAGVGEFTGDLGHFTDLGFAWGGRLGVQFVPAVGVELGYEGINSTFSGVILPNGIPSGDFTVLQQAFSLNGRAGVPLRISDSQLYIYGLTGAGYSNIFMSQGGFLVGTSTDSAFLLPVGGGASFIFPGGFMIDGRYTYNVLSGDRSPVIKTGNSWTAALNLGARFGR